MGFTAWTWSISFLVLQAMLGRAIKNPPGHQTLASRQGHAALGAAHHVLARTAGAARALIGRPLPPRVRLEKPVHRDDDEQDDEVLQCRRSRRENAMPTLLKLRD